MQKNRIASKACDAGSTRLYMKTKSYNSAPGSIDNLHADNMYWRTPDSVVAYPVESSPPNMRRAGFAKYGRRNHCLPESR